MTRTRRVGAAVWGWWNTPFMARFGRFIVVAAIIGVVWAFLRRHPFNRSEDGLLLLAIACGAASIAITTAIGVFWITRDWTLRATGLVGFATADALLYFVFADPRYRWFDMPEWSIALVRACFLVGLPILLAGMVLWVVRIYRAYHSGRIPRDKL